MSVAAQVFQNIASQLTNSQTASPGLVSISQYNTWKKHWLFQALTNQSFGQSFCRDFGIDDWRLYYDRNQKRCDKLIRACYLHA